MASTTSTASSRAKRRSGSYAHFAHPRRPEAERHLLPELPRAPAHGRLHEDPAAGGEDQVQEVFGVWGEAQDEGSDRHGGGQRPEATIAPGRLKCHFRRRTLCQIHAIALTRPTQSASQTRPPRTHQSHARIMTFPPPS